VEQVGAPLEGATERIATQLGDVMLHRKLEDLLPDLPEVEYVTVDVELDREERALYDQLATKWWADLGDGEILLVPSEVARMTRLRQVVSDVEILGAERAGKPGSKIAAAAEICGDLAPEQVVVLCWSRAAAERVAAEAGGVYVHGGVAAGDRDLILERFAAGKVRVLAGTLATLGEGVDGLQVARYLIRLDRDWTPARNTQAVARLQRSGQRSSVVVYDLVADDTVDQWVERALRAKTSVIEAVLAAMRRE
jgi:SNF2 family DNA or RNA helicase